MAKDISVDKICKELSKGSPNEQYQALEKVKEFVASNIADEMSKKSAELNELKTKLGTIETNQ